MFYSDKRFRSLQATICTTPAGISFFVVMEETRVKTEKKKIMKKTLFTMLVAMFVVFASHAQINLGIKGGLNLYKISIDDSDKTDMKPGMHIGLLSHIHVTENFALQPEIYYSAQGAKSEFDGDERTTNLNYVNVPLLFQYMFDNGFRLQAGPQLGILTAAKFKEGGNSTDVKGSFNSLEFGIPLGVGYVSPSGFGIDARYNLGLSNISENDMAKAYNRGVQVGLFYLFNHD